MWRHEDLYEVDRLRCGDLVMAVAARDEHNRARLVTATRAVLELHLDPPFHEPDPLELAVVVVPAGLLDLLLVPVVLRGGHRHPVRRYQPTARVLDAEVSVLDPIPAAGNPWRLVGRRHQELHGTPTFSSLLGHGCSLPRRS